MKITDTKTWGQTKKVLYRFIEDACNSYVLQGNNQQWEVIEPKLDFLLASQLEEVAERVEKMKPPYKSQLCQNRNQLDYCGTCEQAWEDCSCPARNTGYKRCLNDVLSYLKGGER